MSNVLDFSVSGQFPSKVGGTGTAIKYFPRPLGASIGVAPSTPSSVNASGALLIPGQNVYNAQQMNVLVTGSFGSDTGDPSGTVNIGLYAVTGSLTAPTYTALATTTAQTPLFGAAYPFLLDVTLAGDSNSGILQGDYIAIVRNAFVHSTPAVLDNTITGLNFNTGNPLLSQGAVFGLVVGVTFGTSDATNTASLFEFTVES